MVIMFTVGWGEPAMLGMFNDVDNERVKGTGVVYRVLVMAVWCLLWFREV